MPERTARSTAERGDSALELYPIRASARKFLWHVRVVGAVYMDSAVLVFASGAGRSRVWRDGDDHVIAGAESVRDVSRICELWLGSGAPGTA